MSIRTVTTTIFFLLFCTTTVAQVKNTEPTSAISIDHVPVVVNNLEKIKKLLSETLHFTIKDGREHEGIKNCFIKFQDGTYIEFTMPLDSTKTIGKYYTNFIKHRQGATSLAVSVLSSDTIKKYLQQRNIQFTSDSNRTWKTVEPQNADIFYIEYADKNWKDTKENTTHPNNSISLKSAWVICKDLQTGSKKYSMYGFSPMGRDKSSKYFSIGNSKLLLLNTSSAKKLTSKFKATDMDGICGLSIKVKSLSALNKLLSKSGNLIIEKKRTLYFLNEYNLFFEFIE